MSKFIFTVSSELYVAGRDEDGEYVSEAFFVVATDKAGNRYTKGFFPGCNVVEDNEGFTHFVDVRKAAEAKAEALSDACRNENPEADAEWETFYPVYGSAAYSEEDVIAWENTAA